MVYFWQKRLFPLLAVPYKSVPSNKFWAYLLDNIWGKFISLLNRVRRALHLSRSDPRRAAPVEGGLTLPPVRGQGGNSTGKTNHFGDFVGNFWNFLMLSVKILEQLYGNLLGQFSFCAYLLTY